MSGKLIFPRAALSPSKLMLGATSQAGRTFFGMVPATTNAGGLSFTPSGTPAADMTLRLKVVDSGELKTATFLASVDAGANYLGRKVDTTWDGNGAAERVVLADTAECHPSRPISIDTNGDGVDDRIVVAVLRTSTTPDQIDILYTDDFTGAGSWSTLKSDVTAGAAPDVMAPALLFRSGVLYCFCSSPTGMMVYKSLDYGVTFGAGIVVAADAEFGCDAVLLGSGKMAVIYLKIVSTYSHVFIRTSMDGTTWTATPKQVTTGSISFTSPSIVQEADGKTIVFARDETTSPNQIKARQTTAVDPATGTWATYSETLWAADATDARASVTIAPDGTLYAVISESDSDQVDFSKFKDGDANWSAVAVVYNPANAIGYPRIGVIGGALWCAALNAATSDIVLITSRYWTAYDASTAPASWTGTAAQYVASGIWVTPGGSLGSVGDTYEMTTRYNYSAGRMLALRPRQPSRSTVDGVEWSCVFDLGANVLVPIDLICAWANVDHFHLQMNATNTWNSPSVDTAVSFVRETIASGGYSVVAGKATRTAGTFVPGQLAGGRVRFGTLAAGTVYEIADNDETNLYIEADISGASGDMVIYSPRAWKAQTKSAYRYVRVLINAQDTAEGYYEIPVLLLGAAYSLAEEHVAAIDHYASAEDSRTIGNTITRQSFGRPWREFRLSLNGPELEMYQALSAKFAQLGTQPLAYIDDATNAFDWALCYPDGRIKWSPVRTEIILVESD